MNIKTILLVQSLGLLIVILLEYLNSHPISDLLGGSSKWDGTSNVTWFYFIIYTLQFMLFTIK